MERFQRGLHEGSLAIEDINGGIGRLAVDTERHAQLRHLALKMRRDEEEGNYKHGVNVVNVRNSLITVGSSSSRVILASIHHATLASLFNLLGSCFIGEIPIS